MSISMLSRKPIFIQKYMFKNVFLSVGGLGTIHAPLNEIPDVIKGMASQRIFSLGAVRRLRKRGLPL